MARPTPLVVPRLVVAAATPTTEAAAAVAAGGRPTEVVHRPTAAAPPPIAREDLPIEEAVEDRPTPGAAVNRRIPAAAVVVDHRIRAAAAVVGVTRGVAVVTPTRVEAGRPIPGLLTARPTRRRKRTHRAHTPHADTAVPRATREITPGMTDTTVSSCHPHHCLVCHNP